MKSLGVKKFHYLLLASSIEAVLIIIALLSDTVLAGHLGGALNDEPLSAMNIIIPIVSIMTCISCTLSFGTKFFYNKALGEENKEHSDEIFGMGLFTSIVTGIITFMIVKNGINLYFDFLKTDDIIKFYFYEYFRYFQFDLLLTPLLLFLSGMVYNDGDELIANCANFMNIIGNVILSAVFAFYFKMGISGIALGTLLKDIFQY